MSTAASQHPSDPEAMAVIVMGVSGCGKTSVGEKLAEALHCQFIEGDSLHPAANIAKMSAGIPLDDGDRWPWLDVIGTHLAESRLRGETIVISCSALKKVYRDRLRQAAGGHLAFIFLEGSRAVFEARIKNRPGHFMPASLIDSQFAALEPPNAEPGVVTIDVTLSIETIATQALGGLRKLATGA
jgi:gluconokinase